MFWRWRRRAPVSARGVPTTIDRLRGCLLAGAIGDAAGAAREGRPPAPAVTPVRLRAITDDTQLTLSTCLAIARDGAARPASIAASLLDWHVERGYRGLGAATSQALQGLAHGGHWALVGRKGEHAAGDGAAVRIAPLAFVDDPRRGRVVIRDVSRITHHSDEAYVGALALALALHDAATGDVAPALASIAALLPDTGVRDRLLQLSSCESIAAAARRGCSAWVVDAVPLSLLAAAVTPRDGLETMLSELVAAGGDCDSIASMAGQCWGARFGAAAIPERLLQQLTARDEIEGIAQRLGARLGLRA